MNNIADKLYNILGTKFNNTTIKTLDSKGKETTDMEEIEMFSFDFIVDSRNYGPVVILLSAEDNLEVYYGDNTSKTLDHTAKKKWENLIEHLSTFARGNRLGFSLKHTTDLKYDLSNLTDITESYRHIFEGYYGTKNTSYSPQGNAKIIIKHSKAIGEDDKRFRNISQIFIENADGERFKLPFKKLTGARAMARHVTEGGNPYDLFGLHICEMVKDINTLGGFVRRSSMYEGNDDALAMVETGRTHYTAMRKGLGQIAGKRGYHTYKESWEPSAITEQDVDTDSIRKLFTEKTVNQRTEDALPLLARLQQMAEASDLLEDSQKAYLDIGHLSSRDVNKLADQLQASGLVLGTDFFLKSGGESWILYSKYDGNPLDILMHYNVGEDELDEAHEITERAELKYKGLTVEINPWKKGFAARARNRRGIVVATAPGKTEEAALDAIKPLVDEIEKTQKKVTSMATLDFNADFTRHLLKSGEDEIWVKLVAGPKLVIAAGDMYDMGPEILKGYGFSRSARRNPNAAEESTPLLAVPLTAKQAATVGAVANGRYVIDDVTKDEDGNRVYQLHYDSTVTAPGEKFRMGVPAVTVGTLREATVESEIEWPEEIKGSGEFPGDYHPDQPDDMDDDDDIPMPRFGPGPRRQMEGRDEDEWGSAMGYDQDDEDEIIGGPDNESFVIDTLSGEDSAKVIGFLEEIFVDYDSVGNGKITIHLDRDTLDASTIVSQLHRIANFDEVDDMNEAALLKRIDHANIKKLVANYARTKSPEDYKAAREAGASMVELQAARNQMKEADEFEQWADSLVEGSWALPETSKQVQELTAFLSKPQPAGVDGMNATTALYNLIGDDDLFDRITDATRGDPEADIRPIVIRWIKDAINNKLEFTNPAVIQNLQKVVSQVKEGIATDLDADNEAQLNASINKEMDEHLQEAETDSNLAIQWNRSSPSSIAYFRKLGLKGNEYLDADVEDSTGEELWYVKVDGNRYRVDSSTGTVLKEGARNKIAESTNFDLDALLKNTRHLLRK